MLRSDHLTRLVSFADSVQLFHNRSLQESTVRSLTSKSLNNPTDSRFESDSQLDPKHTDHVVQKEAAVPLRWVTPPLLYIQNIVKKLSSSKPSSLKEKVEEPDYVASKSLSVKVKPVNLNTNESSTSLIPYSKAKTVVNDNPHVQTTSTLFQESATDIDFETTFNLLQHKKDSDEAVTVMNKQPLLKDSIKDLVVIEKVVKESLPVQKSRGFKFWSSFLFTSDKKPSLKDVVRAKDAGTGRLTLEKKSNLISTTAHSTNEKTNTNKKISSKIFNIIENIENKVKPLPPKAMVSKMAVETRTRGLVASVRRATSHMSKVARIEELCRHLMKYPETRSVAAKEQAVSSLLRIKEAAKRGGDMKLVEQCRIGLCLLGYADTIRGQGIRILCIDGGGTRGVVTLEILKYLDALTDKPLYQLFDYVCGVSTGALIGSLIAVNQISLADAEYRYKTLSADVFQQDTWTGRRSLVMTHAYYNTTKWQTTLKQNVGESLMIDAASKVDCPKMGIISTVINKPHICSYVFRNYNHPPSVQSHYPGSSQYTQWEAVQASAAAPGYFEEVRLGDNLHQDGGMLMNNPTAIAIHESRLLWPNKAIQCVISVGNGRYEPQQVTSETSFSSLKTKVTKVLASATDTEGIHTTLQDLLPPSVYFRFNPYLSEEIMLDETRPEKLEALQHDAQMYIRKNDFKLRNAMAQLSKESSFLVKCYDWLKFKRDVIGY